MSFKDWYKPDEHDLYNFPDEAMEEAWNAALAEKPPTLEAIMIEYDSMPDAGAWEGDHPIMQMAAEIDSLRDALKIIQRERDAYAELAIPPGYVAMPVELTAENGAKGLLMGEFIERVLIDCDYCINIDECHKPAGECRHIEERIVSWTTTKAMYKKMVEGLAR